MRRGLIVLVCVVGCDVRSPGAVTGGPGGGNNTDLPDGLAIEAFATPLQVVAGGTAAVNCVVRQNGALVEGAATAVDVQPAPTSLTETDSAYSVRFNRAGLYALRCTTSEGALASPDVHVTVVPGTLVGIDTALSPASAGAGAPVAVTCTASDIYGNAPPETLPTAIDTEPEILVDPITSITATVRGTLVGDYDVACRMGNLVDTVPATLTVTPGLPARSETMVDAADVTPTQNVNVSCTVTDAYGNPVSAPSSVVVMPATSAAQSGLVQNGMAFSATRAGLYYVFCAVPGYQAGDESPALVRVHPGLPCTWAYDSLDTSGCFWQGRRLPFYYEVSDYWGNVVDPAPVEMVAIPSTGVTSDGQGGWIFANEGDYDLSFSVLQPHDTDSARNCVGLPGTVALPYIANIRVDSRGPQFTITSPARSAMLLQGGVANDPVAVGGSVTDTLSPITGLVINGSSLAVSGTSLNESISVSQISRWGLTAVTGEAVDECGNRSVLAQAYLRSGQYFAAATAPNSGARAITGILAHLNQPVIDDFDRADIDDMATMGERILLAQDFNALIPPGTVLASEPLRGGCSGCPFGSWWDDTAYTVRRDDNASRKINVEGPYITYLRAIAGGMDFAIRIDQFDFPLEAIGYWRACAGGCQSTIDTGWISGWAGANSVDASGTLGISLVGSVPTVVVQSITVNANGMYLNVDCGILDFVCDAITGSVMPYLESTIEGAMEDAIRQEIPPTLEDFLSGFSLDTGFSLPPPMSMTLNLSSGLDRVLFAGPAGSGWGELGLYTQVYPSVRGSGISATSRGGIRKDGALPTFSASAYTFGMGLKDDLINQMMWALWYGGGMDLPDVTSMLGGSGIEGVNMSFYAGLPPVIMPGCAPDAQVPSCSGEQIDIGFGDIYVDASVDLGMLLSGTPGDTINVGMYLTMLVGATIDIDPTVNELLVSVDPDPLIYVQVVSIDDPGYQALMSDLFSRLLAIVAPNLVASVLGSFPIPEFDLGGIVPLCSAYSFRQLNCQRAYCTWTGSSCTGGSFDNVWALTNGSIVRVGDYYRLTGSLQ